MRFVIRFLGAEILSVELGTPSEDEEPGTELGGASGQFDYGFASPRPRWSPLRHSDDEDE